MRFPAAWRTWPVSKIITNIIVFYNVENTSLLYSYSDSLKPVSNILTFVIYSVLLLTHSFSIYLRVSFVLAPRGSINYVRPFALLSRNLKSNKEDREFIV